MIFCLALNVSKGLILVNERSLDLDCWMVTESMVHMKFPGVGYCAFSLFLKTNDY